MKTNIFKKLLFATVLASVFTGCIHDDEFDNVTSECVTLTPTKTVTEIYDLAEEGTPVQYTQDDIIEAYVTSSDEGGTFYKSISFQSVDGSLGFSIPVDMYNIYNEFEPGRKVYVNLKNRYFNKTHDGLVIGDLYQETAVGRLVPEEFRRTVKASCEAVDEEEIVQHLTIDEAMDDSNLNKLIEIDNVQFEDAAMGTTYYNPADVIGGATNINLVDADGNTLIFRTSEFAKFAGHEVSAGNGKIRGVLTKFNNDYQFLARTESDIQLNNPRVVPLFEETFSTNFANWSKQSVTGTQGWVLESVFGHPAPCAKMSGFQSGSNANEDWLISPSIDMSGVASATLTFETATDFTGNALQVYISTNYVSGLPSTATWTQLSATVAPTDSNFTWTSSGSIDVSSYAGNANVRIAYKYTSTTSASATWEVDNVKIVSGN